MTRREISRIVARNIRAVRVAESITSLALAQRIGIAPGHMSRIESGRRLPELITLCRIATGLNVPLSRLIDGL